MTTKLSRMCDGVMEAAWLAAIVVVPIFFNIYSSRIFEPDKIVVLRTLSLLMLGAWIVKLIEQGEIRWNNFEWKGSILKTIRSIPMLLPVVGLALIYIISTLFSVTPRISFWGSYQRLQGTYTALSYLIVFAALIGNLRRKEQIERIVTAIILSSLPVSLYGILQRISIDPVPWGGNVSNRIASNMGNSIFVAAYLIMVIPIGVGRIIQSLTAILHDEDKLWNHIIQASIYIFIVSVNVIAVIMSGSRGPFLGLMAGMVLLVLLLTIYWRVRWATWILMSISLLAVIFLILLNSPNGPLESLRGSSWVGRFSQIFDTEQRTSQVRILIWQGASDLVLPHDPLSKPDGSQDSFNFLRPLIGYGSESMYVAYNQFYPPELGRVEKRNASPDRSHNETWDSVVTTGLIGLSVYLWIYVSVFYYSLKWLGLFTSSNQRKLFWSLIFLSGFIGILVVGFWQGWEFFGVGLPFGLIFGIMLYVSYYSLFVRYSDSGTDNYKNPYSILLITLLVAIVAHFAEINFGISIAITHTYLWIYTALIVIIGFLPHNIGSKEPDATLAQTPPKKQRIRFEPVLNQHRSRLSSHLLAGSFITGLILSVLGYDFITNSIRSTSITKVISSSFTQLPNRDGALSFGILALILSIWFIGSIIFTSENLAIKTNREWWKTFGNTLGISAGIAFLFYIVHSGAVIKLTQLSVENQNDLISQADRLGGLFTAFVVFLFILIFVFANFLPLDAFAKRRTTSRGWMTAIATLIVVWFFAFFFNIRVVHADMTFKMADPFTKSDQWPVATLLYQYALKLMPNEDHYYLFLGRSYLEQAKDLENIEDQTALISKAEEDLTKAQSINPLNTDHTANLGRLHSWWAGRATTVAERNERATIASQYYEIATQLSPNNPTIWGEWAILNLELLGDRNTAQELLLHAINLDEMYNFTQGLMGDYYLRLARAETGIDIKTNLIDKAITYYTRAVEVSVGRDASTKPNYLISLGNSYIERASVDPQNIDPNIILKAITTFQLAQESGIKKAEIWKIEETIAKLYYQINDITNAIIHANLALKYAPEEQAQRIQSLVDQLTSIQTIP